MKPCRACGGPKPVGARRQICDPCGTTSKERWRNTRRKKYRDLRVKYSDLVTALKDRPCMDCGKRYPSHVMDFDHRPGVTKRKMVSVMCGYSPEEILAEVEKCDVVCANCHRERTHQRMVETWNEAPTLEAVLA